MSSITRLLTPLLVTHVLEMLAAGFAAMLLLLLGGLILQKLGVESAHRRRTQALDRYRRELLEIQQGKRAALTPPLQRFERQALASAVAAGGEAALPSGAVAVTLRSCGVLDALRHDAADKAWGQRYAAYEALGKLGLPEARDFLYDAARGEADPRAFAAALTAAARLALDSADLARSCDFILSRPVLSAGFNEGILRSALRALLRRHGSDTVARMVNEHLDDMAANEAVALGLIAACGREGLLALQPALEEFYERGSHRVAVKLACLRALGRLESPSRCFFAGLRDLDWRVRATSARFAWIMGLSAVKPLAERLTDEAFHTRLNAAVALLRLGSEGRRALGRAQGSGDRFARDVSAYALARGDALVVTADLTGSYPRIHRFAPRRRRGPRAPQHA